MEKDFEIGQSNELIRQGIIYDLHNLYDFARLTIEGNSRVQILFMPNVEHGSGHRSILLEFDGIDYLELSTNFGIRQLSLLEEMGYKNPEDHDHDWLMSERQATMRDHLFFRFGSDDFIRVHSQRVLLREGIC